MKFKLIGTSNKKSFLRENKKSAARTYTIFYIAYRDLASLVYSLYDICFSRIGTISCIVKSRLRFFQQHNLATKKANFKRVYKNEMKPMKDNFKFHKYKLP